MKDLNLNQKLSLIQKEFKANKSKFNSFGKYNFRSAEDILEALKPFNEKYQVSFVISEKLIDFNNTPYVELQDKNGTYNAPTSVPIIESKATILDNNGINEISATAIVGVDLNQKGMQVPQQFGSASSYGKKYALGNLLLIDDTQDPDATNTHGRDNAKSATTEDEQKWLNVNTPEFTKAIEYLKNGGNIEAIEKKYKSVLAGKPNVFIHKTKNENQDVYREIYLHPILLNNKVVEVSVIAQNITERVKSENKIIEQSAKLKAIFESGDQLMWTITKDLKLTSFNQNYSNAVFDLYGYYPEIGKTIRGDKTKSSHSLWNEKYALAFEDRRVEFISERTTQGGKKNIRQIILYPIKDNSNKVLEISGIGFDITENKINEEKITQSLKEKEILLREVHHRVKNNMQVISSILNLQSSYVKDSYALNLLKECQNRIKSMAFIHESLYQTKNFESVNFSEYVTVLTKNLVHTYSINTKKIKLILTLHKLFLNLDLSIPCGLIINEIISNSLKYAFPNNRDGIIFVNLTVNKKNVKIEVGDNGVGIPQKVDVKNTQTLGLQLVDTLVEQINGTLKLNRNKGTIFSIEFNI